MQKTILPAIAALAIASTANAALVANYTFDDTLDLGANTGTVSTAWNATTGATATTGKFGGGLAMEAGTTEYWDNSFSTGADLSSFSVSMHVKGAGTNWGDYLSIGVGNSTMFFEMTDGGNVAIWSDGDPGGVTVSTVGSTVVNDGAWHQLGLVSNGTTIQLYVDGVAEGTPSAYTGSGAINSLQLGKRFGGSHAISADIDDVAIYDTALSANEMLSLSTNAAVAVPEPSSTALLGLGGIALILRRRK